MSWLILNDSSEEDNTLDDGQTKLHESVPSYDWEIINTYFIMKNYCDENRLFIMDECHGYDLINFINQNTQ